jgi:hypothetical protein
MSPTLSHIVLQIRDRFLCMEYSHARSWNTPEHFYHTKDIDVSSRTAWWNLWMKQRWSESQDGLLIHLFLHNIPWASSRDNGRMRQRSWLTGEACLKVRLWVPIRTEWNSLFNEALTLRFLSHRLQFQRARWWCKKVWMSKAAANKNGVKDCRPVIVAPRSSVCHPATSHRGPL